MTESFLQAMVDLGYDENLAKDAWDNIEDKENKTDAEIEQEGTMLSKFLIGYFYKQQGFKGTCIATECNAPQSLKSLK